MPDQNLDEEKIRDIAKDIFYEQMKKKDKPKPNVNPLYKKLAVDFTNVHNVSLQTLNYSLELGGKFAEAGTLNTIHDCADICQLMDSLIIRQSDLANEFASICKSACEKCIKLAELLPDDPQFKELFKYCQIALESVKKLN